MSSGSPPEPERIDAGGVRGVLHRTAHPAADALVLTHGAGSSCDSPLVRAVAEAFAAAGVTVLRCDLPFRQARPAGPPPPGAGVRDRAGLADAVAAVRRFVPGRVFLGGHSYWSRQASILAADAPDGIAGLLLAYPLHPPGRPAALRVEHFPRLRTPALFVHGSRDPFGSPDELRAALARIPAATALRLVDGAGHDLRRLPPRAGEAVAALLRLVR